MHLLRLALRPLLIAVKLPLLHDRLQPVPQVLPTNLPIRLHSNRVGVCFLHLSMPNLLNVTDDLHFLPEQSVSPVVLNGCILCGGEPMPIVYLCEPDE